MFRLIIRDKFKRHIELNLINPFASRFGITIIFIIDHDARKYLLFTL